MAGFSDFASLVEADTPDKSRLLQDVGDLHDVLTDRYCRARYAEFAIEKYGQAALAADKSYEFLSFSNCLTEAEAWELYTWCSSSAKAWIEEVCDRITQTLAKTETTLQVFADNLHSNFSVALEASYSDSGMGSVADTFRESWKDAAGEAIRAKYSDNWAQAAIHMSNIAHALANGAETELVLLKAAREHIDSLIKIVAYTLENGPGPSPFEEAVFKYLGNEVVGFLEGKHWAVKMASEVYKGLNPEAAEAQPRLTTDDPEAVKVEFFGAFDQLEDILRSDREAFGQSLTSAFDEYRDWLTEDPSRLLPRPTVDEVDWS